MEGRRSPPAETEGPEGLRGLEILAELVGQSGLEVDGCVGKGERDHGGMDSEHGLAAAREFLSPASGRFVRYERSYKLKNII